MVNRTPSVPPTQAVVCRNCSYDANAPTSTHCEVCGQVLEAPIHSSPVSRKKFVPILGWLGLGTLLVLLSGAGYLFWKQQQAHQGGGELSQTSDIRPRKTMAKVQDVPKGVFNYGGAFLFAALKTAGMNEAIARTHPEFSLRYTEPINQKPGSGTGIQMLMDRQLSFAQSGRPIQDAEYAKANTRGVKLELVPVAIDGIVFFTHPDINIAGLSLDQAQSIFMGDVTNWSQLGGPDVAITPVSLDPKTTSSLQVIFEGLAGGASLTSSAEIVRDYTMAIRKVSELPGAISYASAPSVVHQKSIRLVKLSSAKTENYISAVTDDQAVNAVAFRVGSYPLTRQLFVVLRRDGSVDEKAGVAYANLLLSLEGQQIIEKAGFVPIR